MESCLSSNCLDLQQKKSNYVYHPSPYVHHACFTPENKIHLKLRLHQIWWWERNVWILFLRICFAPSAVARSLPLLSRCALAMKGLAPILILEKPILKKILTIVHNQRQVSTRKLKEFDWGKRRVRVCSGVEEAAAGSISAMLRLMHDLIKICIFSWKWLIIDAHQLNDWWHFSFLTIDCSFFRDEKYNSLY